MSITTLFNQSIVIATKSGYDAYGRESTSSNTTVKSRFQKTTKQKLLPNGSLTTIEAVVYVPPSTTVAIDDKVTYGSVDYKVFGRYDAIDGSGDTNHIKLELVKWLTT